MNFLPHPAKSLCARLPPKFWPELRIRNAAAQTRIVSGGWLWPGRRELSCYFKYMARGRIPEFESHHPSHVVVSSAVMTGVERRACPLPSRLEGSFISGATLPALGWGHVVLLARRWIEDGDPPVFFVANGMSLED